MSKYLEGAIKLIQENDPFRNNWNVNYRKEITDNAMCTRCHQTFTIKKDELQYEPVVECPNCRAVQRGQEAIDHFDLDSL